jgi:hypothetical protein
MHAPSAPQGGRQVDQKVVITLDPEDLQELERILMDREEKDALRFLRERFEKKVQKTTKGHCRPPFD